MDEEARWANFDHKFYALFHSKREGISFQGMKVASLHFYAFLVLFAKKKNQISCKVWGVFLCLQFLNFWLKDYVMSSDLFVENH